LREAKGVGKAHERVTHAESEVDRVHTDAERVRRLAEYSAKHGAGPD
jgi:hypothetical protein